jgi:hypothetical protein
MIIDNIVRLKGNIYIGFKRIYTRTVPLYVIIKGEIEIAEHGWANVLNRFKLLKDKKGRYFLLCSKNGNYEILQDNWWKRGYRPAMYSMSKTYPFGTFICTSVLAERGSAITIKKINSPCSGVYV